MLIMSLFSPSNVNKFITHAILPLEMIIQELIGLSVVKTEPMGHLQVV
jgi:hypothetical protein